MKNQILSMIILFCLFVGKSHPQDNHGLTGILYDDTQLTRIFSVWHLEHLDSDQADWPDKNDFSARWTGYLKIPSDSEISFFAEVDNEIRLKINNRLVLDTWNKANKHDGHFKADKDSLYTVTLLYRQINGPSYMRVFWSWAGQEKQIIPQTAFSYSKEMEAAVLSTFEKKTNVDMSELVFDVASIITIRSPQDVPAKRQALIDVLWGKNGFPFDKQPDSIITAVSDSDFVALDNLKRIDKLVIEMESGFNSIVYHFVPQNDVASAAIYHQGHGGKFTIGLSTIRAFLEKGYHLFAMSMPLLGMNRKPVVNTKHYGKLIMHSHNQMILLEPKTGHPVKYFMEPVAVVSNYAQKYNFKKLIMVGLSGGGWTTTLYAAIDPRITISYPVAGTLPHYLRARDFGGSGSMGDYEQRAPEIYKVANYLELYIMGSFGKGRHQLQILNEFDACCFRGTGYTTYLDIIQERLVQLASGHFDVFLDSSHRLHQVSPAALQTIFNDLDEGRN